MKNILRWFAEIGATFKKRAENFSGASRPPLDIAAEARAESAAATPTATATLITAIIADAKAGHDAQAGRNAPTPPNQQEIQRRRELVRTLFNDFWSGRDDKPAAFADRLDEAKTYLNERLTAFGEFWQLDAKTRQMLSLPPRSNSRAKGNGVARPI